MKKLAFLLPFFLSGLFPIAQSLDGVDTNHLTVWPEALWPTTDAAPVKPPVQTVALPNGGQLEYVEQGNKNGVPVVLLHGFSDSWRSWETVLPHLPSSLRVFALSQRGHGNSSKHFTAYRPQDFADDAAAFMKIKGLKNAVFVGHSMGSTVAQCFAVRHPRMAKAVVLASSFANYGRSEVTEFKKVIDALTDPVDSTFVAEFQKSTVLKPIPGLSLDTIVAESRKLPAQVWKGVAAGWAVSDFRKALRAYRKPALIVWGDKDAYCPHSDQDELCQALKSARLLVYEGTGHAVHWEAPERLAKDLAAFVQSLSPKQQ